MMVPGHSTLMAVQSASRAPLVVATFLALYCLTGRLASSHCGLELLLPSPPWSACSLCSKLGSFATSPWPSFESSHLPVRIPLSPTSTARDCVWHPSLESVRHPGHTLLLLLAFVLVALGAAVMGVAQRVLAASVRRALLLRLSLSGPMHSQSLSTVSAALAASQLLADSMILHLSVALVVVASAAVVALEGVHLVHHLLLLAALA